MSSSPAYPNFQTYPLENHESTIQNTPLPHEPPTVGPTTTIPLVSSGSAPIPETYLSSVPLRKSTRSTAKLAWSQDFVTSIKACSPQSSPK